MWMIDLLSFYIFSWNIVGEVGGNPNSKSNLRSQMIILDALHIPMYSASMDDKDSKGDFLDVEKQELELEFTGTQNSW